MVPDEVLHRHALLFHDLLGHAHDDGLLILELAHVTDERNHDLRHDRNLLPGQLAGRLHDGAGLHFRDLGIRDAEPDAAVAKHRIELV
jgi:hypothetical protein